MPPAPPHLWLVRHARPLIDAGICYGRHDVPADADAIHACAARLQAALPGRLAGAATSPLRRCEQLAQALQALRPDLAFETDHRLAELDFGTWENRAWDHIPRADIDAWTADFASHRPGGGEALTDMLARVQAALAHATQQALDHGGDVLWITHAGVARCVQWLQQHGAAAPLSHEWTAPAPGYGEWLRVPLAPAGTGAKHLTS